MKPLPFNYFSNSNNKIYPRKADMTFRRLYKRCVSFAIQSFGTLLSLEWTTIFKSIVQSGHFMFSLPFHWEPSPDKMFSVGKLRVTRSKWRISFAKMMVILSLLDCICRMHFALVCDYGAMKDSELLEMYLELFSRFGCGLLSIHPIFRPEYHVTLVNHLLKLDAVLSK